MKTKSYGPSNDKIPEDEEITAKLIAFTKAKGLVAIRGAFCHRDINNKTVGVCAMGAADLANIDVDEHHGMGSGNDGKDPPTRPTDVTGYAIGVAFYDACKPEGHNEEV